MSFTDVPLRVETETALTGPQSGRDELAERRRHDDDLRRFGAAMEASGDAVLLIDPQRMALVHANPSACKMLGYPRSQLLTQSPERLFATLRSTLSTAWQALLAGDRSGDTYETQ